MRNQAKAALARIEETPPGKDALRLWLRLLTTTHLVEKHVRARFRDEFATTLPRFDVLAALERAPRDQSMSELSRRLMVSNGNLTGVVQRLADDGLVERSRKAGDRRTQYVKLSARGATEFRLLSRAHEQWIEELFGGLSGDERAALQDLLRKTRENLAARTGNGDSET